MYEEKWYYWNDKIIDFWRIWIVLELELDYTTMKNNFKYIAFWVGAIGTIPIHIIFLIKFIEIWETYTNIWIIILHIVDNNIIYDKEKTNCRIFLWRLLLYGYVKFIIKLELFSSDIFPMNEFFRIHIFLVFHN